MITVRGRLNIGPTAQIREGAYLSCEATSSAYRYMFVRQSPETASAAGFTARRRSLRLLDWARVLTPEGGTGIEIPAH
jgi:hypothetical protein